MTITEQRSAAKKSLASNCTAILAEAERLRPKVELAGELAETMRRILAGENYDRAAVYALGMSVVHLANGCRLLEGAELDKAARSLFGVKP